MIKKFFNSVCKKVDVISKFCKCIILIATAIFSVFILIDYIISLFDDNVPEIEEEPEPKTENTPEPELEETYEDKSPDISSMNIDPMAAAMMGNMFGGMNNVPVQTNNTEDNGYVVTTPPDGPKLMYNKSAVSPIEPVKEEVDDHELDKKELMEAELEAEKYNEDDIHNCFD